MTARFPAWLLAIVLIFTPTVGNSAACAHDPDPPAAGNDDSLTPGFDSGLWRRFGKSRETRAGQTDPPNIPAPDPTAADDSDVPRFPAEVTVSGRRTGVSGVIEDDPAVGNSPDPDTHSAAANASQKRDAADPETSNASPDITGAAAPESATLVLSLLGALLLLGPLLLPR